MDKAHLSLTLPWAPEVDVNGLSIRHGTTNVLEFDDGIELEVVLVEPESSDNPTELTQRVKNASGPGRVALVAGRISPQWRSELRRARVSWVDYGGTFEFHWPRVNASWDDYPSAIRIRDRQPLGLQQGRAAVVQELCQGLLEHRTNITISSLAEQAGLSLATCSRTIGDLAANGLLRHDGPRSPIQDANLDQLASLLSTRTSWKRASVVFGYSWGVSEVDAAVRLTQRASVAGVEASVTGRLAAMLFGIFGATPPDRVRVRVRCAPKELIETCAKLGLEVVPREEANIEVAADPWRLGMLRAQKRDVNGVVLPVASPLRTWCDLADERRGSEFAAQLWEEIISD